MAPEIELDDVERKILASMVEYKLPAYMAPSLMAYVLRGVPPDPEDFLFALLSNDFMLILRRADDNNRARLLEWGSLIHNDLPGGCHGSAQDVSNWVDLGGLENIEL